MISVSFSDIRAGIERRRSQNVSVSARSNQTWPEEPVKFPCRANCRRNDARPCAGNQTPHTLIDRLTDRRARAKGAQETPSGVHAGSPSYELARTSVLLLSGEFTAATVVLARPSCTSGFPLDWRSPERLGPLGLAGAAPGLYAGKRSWEVSRVENTFAPPVCDTRADTSFIG